MGLLDFVPRAHEIPQAEIDKRLVKAPRRTAAVKQSNRRDSRGWRSAPKVNKFGEPSKAGEQASAKRHENEVRAETRRKVWKRSDVCEGCGDDERQSAEKWPKSAHECHETVYRSRTRNRPPEERFTTERSARTCWGCHKAVHDKRLAFDPLTDEGMDGSYSAIWKRPDGTYHVVPNPRDRQAAVSESRSEER